MGELNWFEMIAGSLGGVALLMYGIRIMGDGLESAAGDAMRRILAALTRNAWMFLYVFIAIQSAWVLRPFVGAPDLPVRFFREEAWDNAYVRIFRAILRVLS